MSASETLKAEARTTLGSRNARKLRAQGRITCSLQSFGDNQHVEFSIDEAEFLATRRHHTHLYEVGLGGGKPDSAVVHELQWDTFGEHILHVEFKKVRTDIATESEVELEFFGHPKGGVTNHLLTHVRVSCLPGLIPDSIEIKVGELEPGDHVMASELEMPEGVELITPLDTMLVTVAVPRGEVEETEEETLLEGEAPATDQPSEPSEPTEGS